MPDGSMHLRADWTHRVRLPSKTAKLEQDEEWCEIEEKGEWRRLRFHDYADIFSRAGLYEHLFYGLLRCSSPERVATMLEAVLREAGQNPADLRTLDLGAGNGMLGESLKRRGFGEVMGVDLLPEAKMATERDRPRTYDDYLVADLIVYADSAREQLERFAPTCLTTVAALGFGDVPPRAYFNALTTVPVGGLLAFNIRTDFLDPRYSFGFSKLVRSAMSANVIRIESMQRYRHRLAVTGEPLWYTAVVATKLAPVPEEMLIAS
jgi:predicted TPR repeat methyltransferase